MKKHVLRTAYGVLRWPANVSPRAGRCTLYAVRFFVPAVVCPNSERSRRSLTTEYSKRPSRLPPGDAPRFRASLVRSSQERSSHSALRPDPPVWYDARFFPCVSHPHFVRHELSSFNGLYSTHRPDPFLQNLRHPKSARQKSGPQPTTHTLPTGRAAHADTQILRQPSPQLRFCHTNLVPKTNTASNVQQNNGKTIHPRPIFQCITHVDPIPYPYA
jgi:hypothetical protein